MIRPEVVREPTLPSTTASQPPFRKTLYLVLTLLIAITAILLSPTILRGSKALFPLSRYLLPYKFSYSTTQPINNMPGLTLPAPVQGQAKSPTEDVKKYTPAEERQWNALAEKMNTFHEHFRYQFNRAYMLADGGFHKEGMSLPKFLRECQELYQHLDIHHKVEEAYIFPILARKMPQFKAGTREGGEHIQSHKAILEGLGKYEAFLQAALANPSSYNATAFREIMDSFREVLFRHLDEEVHDLGGESMKAAGWTLKELRQIPM